MTSITSVISFFILLLVTYSYSAPIEQKYETSTANYKFTSGKTTINEGVKVKKQMMSDDGSTDNEAMPTDESGGNEEMPTDESGGNEEMPTDQSGGNEAMPVDGSTDNQDGTKGVADPVHSVEDPSHPKYPAVIYVDQKRSIEDFLLSNLESSDAFERRAIRSGEPHEEVETSTSVLSEHQIEITTNVEPLSSSVDSFGKFTGLLHDNQPEEQSSTTEYATTDRTDEKSTTQSTVKTQKLIKTVAIIPGKITETKIYVNTPSKTSIVIKPVDEKELIPEHKRPNCLTDKCWFG